MTYRPETLIAPHFLREMDGDVVSTNERSLLRLIWRNPGLSRSELTLYSDLAQQTVHRIVDQLADRNIVVIGSPKPGLGSGQPSPILRLNERLAYSCGISANADVVDICLMDLGGNTLAESSVSLKERSRAQALEHVREQVRSLQTAQGLDEQNFFGIGFAIAGFNVGGTRFNASLPLHEWSLIELGPLMTEVFERPAWVLNGGKAGAVAESMFGVGRHIKDFAYLSFNYGFGGGLIYEGELLHGSNGGAGEYSQMFDREETTCRPALQYLMETLHRHGVNVPSIPYLQKHFDPKWPGVLDWVERTMPVYNRLINAIWAIYDPQAIVFGGQVPPALAQMLSQRTELFGTPNYGAARQSPKLIVSEITTDAAAMGAAITPFKASYY
ncbi:ROK family transcriptional regulator [Agrobacterium sp. SHOUNA12C]|nr:ROK family transcriptional regulator [Agrobacterium sp. BETTINA12B]MCJ9755116.1 ROK family transcriptional regulator [Agrobacterium sp. SHOUNA12C]